jgi:hypothetical protein
MLLNIPLKVGIIPYSVPLYPFHSTSRAMKTAAGPTESATLVTVFEREDFTGASWWDIGSPTRLTVPTGVNFASITGWSMRSTLGGMQDGYVGIRKNGVFQGLTQTDDQYYTPGCPSISVPVVPGDYFDLYIRTFSGTAYPSSGSFLAAVGYSL